MLFVLIGNCQTHDHMRIKRTIIYSSLNIGIMSAPRQINTANNLSNLFGDNCQSKFTPQLPSNKQSLQQVTPTTKPLHPQIHTSQSPKHTHTHTNAVPLVPMQQSQTFPYIPSQQTPNSLSSSSHVFKLESVPMCQSEYQWFSSPEKNMMKQVQQKEQNKVYKYVKSISMMESTLMKAISHYKMYLMYKLNSYSPNECPSTTNKNTNSNNTVLANNVINQTSMKSGAKHKQANQKEHPKNEDQVGQQKVQQSFESHLAVSPPSTKYPHQDILMHKQPKTFQYRQSNQVLFPHLQTYQYAQRYSHPQQKQIQFIAPTQPQTHIFPQIQQQQQQQQMKVHPLPYYYMVEHNNVQHRASSPFMNHKFLEKERYSVNIQNKRHLVSSPSPQTKVFFQYQLQSPKQTLSRPLSQPCLIRPTSSLPQMPTIPTTNRPQSYVPSKYENLQKNNENRSSSIMKSNRQKVRDQYYITTEAKQQTLKSCKSNPNFHIQPHDTPRAHQGQIKSQFQFKAKPSSRPNNNPWEQYAELDQTIINKLNTDTPSCPPQELNSNYIHGHEHQAYVSYEHPIYLQQIKRREQRESKKHPIYMEYRDNIHDKIKAAQRQKLTVVTKSIKQSQH